MGDKNSFGEKPSKRYEGDTLLSIAFAKLVFYFTRTFLTIQLGIGLASPLFSNTSVCPIYWDIST